MAAWGRSAWAGAVDGKDPLSPQPYDGLETGAAEDAVEEVLPETP